MLTVRLLGPVQILSAGRAVDLGPARQRCVLAALAIDAGRPVPIPVLIDRVWDERPPQRVQHTLQVYLSRIRGALRQSGHDALVSRRSGGYALDVDDDQVDILRFEKDLAAVRQGRTTTAEQCDALESALRLWQGQPLADLPGAWAAQVREYWQRRRLDALIHWANARLSTGHIDAVLSGLAAATIEFPLAEPLRAAQMRALVTANRPAEALAAYESARTCLAAELGVDPGPELSTLHRAVLRGEPPSSVTRPFPAKSSAGTPVCELLPLKIRGFAARIPQLRQLDDVLAATRHEDAGAVAVISGTAGAGKTTLAVHWAHTVAKQFPDGQLYVNLRGFDPAGRVMAAGEAVRAFLDALGVAPERIPLQVDAQTALYRSLLAGKRILVLLDNARDAEQVRPLLPGASGCLVVVTSRDTLGGLVAAEGAIPVRLGVLAPAEAWELLERRLTKGRLSAEPQAVKEIIDACARLPLALSVVATRATALPDVRLSTLAEELREARQSLDLFAGSDPATDVRAVFSWSYQRLSPMAAQMFRLLGLHVGPDITTHAAASIVGVPTRVARTLLAELVDNNLLTAYTTHRYTAHDLLRTYAAELTERFDAQADRAAATHRMLDYYLHTACACARMIEPHREMPTIAAPADGVSTAAIDSATAALDWFVVEHTALVAAVQRAADGGLGVHAWQLAWALSTFLNRQGHWHDQTTTQHIALDIARRQDDRTGQAHAHSGLSRAYLRLDRHDDATTHLQQALTLYRELADTVGQARVLDGLGFILSRRGRHQDAIRHIQQALDLFAAGGHEAWYAQGLNDLGWNHALLGNYQEALDYCERALTLMRELGDRHGQANTWDSLGYAHHHLGDQDQAVDCYRHALDLFRQSGERYLEAETLIRLGEALLAAGKPESVRTVWSQALEIFTDLDHPDARTIRARLETLDLARMAGSAAPMGR